MFALGKPFTVGSRHFAQVHPALCLESEYGLTMARDMAVQLVVAALIGGVLGAGFTYAITHFVLK
jgi:hypothetical protein